jgi:hypothetical protein
MVITIRRRGERMTELQTKLPVRNERFWPAAVITCGIGLTVTWVILLGYGIVRLIELAI